VKQYDGKDDETGKRIDSSKVLIDVWNVFSLSRLNSLY